MKVWLTALVALILMSLGIFHYVSKDAKPKLTAIDAEATLAIDELGDLLVTDDTQVFTVNSKTQHSKLILQTSQPISSVNYTSEHTVVTVYNPEDTKAFKGFYIRDKQSDKFAQYATPQLSPKFSYVYGDLMFVSSAEKTAQKGVDMTKVGIYQLKDHKWVKEWLVPGGVEDVKGVGKDVFFVTSNNAETSSNVYKADLQSGDWGKLIQEARRYPLDQVSIDSNGDVYMMISQRNKTEWSNKIFKFDPQQVPYELTSNFVSNTRPYSYTMSALQGKMLIDRYDVTNNALDIEKPLALLDLKSHKQMQLAWDHRPVDITPLGDQFAVLSEDGTIALVGIDASDKPLREFKIEEITAGKEICGKR
ncbi:hypothetical protein [Paenibacillus sp. UNC451MF]|uniref:hypothetical protein n=1 Tax=Paenibacillus sp. UNC451MF TaxID=1449063 RepID=UPI0004918EE8|nr:hypothetical protein [Paenibacillus sp. UNC451MF]